MKFISSLDWMGKERKEDPTEKSDVLAHLGSIREAFEFDDFLLASLSNSEAFDETISDESENSLSDNNEGTLMAEFSLNFESFSKS